MKLFKRQSRYTDDEMRAKVSTLSEEEVEQLIADLGVTHRVFQNWMEAKDKLPNRNKCLHLLGFMMNFDEFRKMINEKTAQVAVSKN